MPTSSFDKEVVITDPEAIDRLVNSLLYDEPRKIEKKYLTPEARERSERILAKFMEGLRAKGEFLDIKPDKESDDAARKR